MYAIHEPLAYSSCFFILCLVKNKCWKKNPNFYFQLKYSNDVNGFNTIRYNYFLCLIFFFLWQRLYKENYEKTKAKSVNYCETPKYQLDTLLKNFSEVRKAVVTSRVWGLPYCFTYNCEFELHMFSFSG